MGRHSAEGKPKLSDTDIAKLAELLDKALEMRKAIDTQNGALPYLSTWVKAVAIPQFHKLRQTTTHEDDQIQWWYNNQCAKYKVTQKRKGGKERPPPATSEIVPCLRSVVMKKYKEEIAQSAREAPEATRDNYMTRWNKALSEKVAMLSQEERESLHAKVDEELERLAHPPTREEVLALQHELPSSAARAVRNILGWERKQHGDAIIFMAVAYRDSSNKICEKNFFVANDDEYTAYSHHFQERFVTYMSGHLTTAAAIGLPKHEVPAIASAAPVPSASGEPVNSQPQETLSLDALPSPDPPPAPAPSPVPVPEPVSTLLVTNRSPCSKSGNFTLPREPAAQATFANVDTRPTPVASQQLNSPRHETGPSTLDALTGPARSASRAPIPEPVPTLLGANPSSRSEPGTFTLPGDHASQATSAGADTILNPAASPQPDSHIEPPPLPLSAQARKPREKRSTVHEAPVRVSTRTKKVPKPTGPLTDKNQPLPKKVRVGKRFFYESDKENTPPLPQKKPRCC